MQFSETGWNPSLILTHFPKISSRQYDSLDPKDRSFLKDYRKFNSKVWMLDRKLSAILTRSAFLLTLFLFPPQFAELLTTALSRSQSSSCCTSLATWSRGTSSPSSSPTRCRSWSPRWTRRWMMPGRYSWNSRFCNFPCFIDLISSSVQDCWIWETKDGKEHASGCRTTKVCQGGKCNHSDNFLSADFSWIRWRPKSPVPWRLLKAWNTPSA